MRFTADTFYFIVSLTDERYISDLYHSVVLRRCNQQEFRSQYLPVHSRIEFYQALSTIKQDTVKGAMPYIHLEAHGSKDNLVLSSGAKISWQSLSSNLTGINLACKNNLFVSLAACYGASICQSVQKKITEGKRPRSPIFGYVGPTQEITYIELAEAFEQYFDVLLTQKDINVAFDSFSDAAKKPHIYELMTSQLLFEEMMNFYVKYKANQPLIHSTQINMGVYANLVGRQLTPGEVELMREVALSEQSLIDAINHLRNVFYMIDLYPENDIRFPKAGRIYNWHRALQHR